MGRVQVPANKSYILTGPEGDLKKYGINDLTFTHTPGHCKGHIVYHHKPSGYMLAGDFADVLKHADGSYSFKTMCARTCNISEAHDTVCRWGAHSRWFASRLLLLNLSAVTAWEGTACRGKVTVRSSDACCGLHASGKPCHACRATCCM
jgi:hypothetical protein